MALLLWMSTALAWDSTKGFPGEGPDLSQRVLAAEPATGEQAEQQVQQLLSQLVLAGCPEEEERDHVHQCTFDYHRFRSKGNFDCAACSRQIPPGKYGYGCRTCRARHVCDRKCQRAYLDLAEPCPARVPQPQPPPLPLPLMPSEPPEARQPAAGEDMVACRDEVHQAKPTNAKERPTPSTRSLLQLATTLPAMPCVRHLPRTLRRRTTPILLASIQAHGSAHHQKERPPGIDAMMWEEECSMWCWLLPSLLRRVPRSGPDDDADAAHAQDDEDACG